MSSIPNGEHDDLMALADAAGVTRTPRVSIVPPAWVADLVDVDDTAPICLYPVDHLSQEALRPDDLYECGSCDGAGEQVLRVDMYGNPETVACVRCDGLGTFVEPEPEPEQFVHDYAMWGSDTAVHVQCTLPGCGWKQFCHPNRGSAADAGDKHVRSQA